MLLYSKHQPKRRRKKSTRVRSCSRQRRRARKTPASTPTNADTLVFLVTFYEGVSGVDAADFAVNGTTTATVTGVSPVTASTYDVTVSGGDLAGFNGTVGLDLAAAQNITDLAGNPLPPGEPATDETYVVDNTAPTVLAFARNTPATSPTNADTLIFDIIFDSAFTLLLSNNNP